MLESCLPKGLLVRCATANDQHTFIERHLKRLDHSGQYAKELRSRPHCHT
jgi:hypothetical protein